MDWQIKARVQKDGMPEETFYWIGSTLEECILELKETYEDVEILEIVIVPCLYSMC